MKYYYFGKNNSSSMVVHFTAPARKQLVGRDYILNALDLGHKKVCEVLELGEIDLLLSIDNRDLIVNEVGMGGITHSATSLEISLDSERLNEALIRRELPALLAHELGHIYQAMHGRDWKATTFEEQILAEGSAMVLQEKLFPAAFNYVNSEVLAEREHWMKEIHPFLEKKLNEFRYQDYMFGGDGTDKPRWIGYSLGYDYCQRKKEGIRQLLLERRGLQ